MEKLLIAQCCSSALGTMSGIFLAGIPGVQRCQGSSEQDWVSISCADCPEEDLRSPNFAE